MGTIRPELLLVSARHLRPTTVLSSPAAFPFTTSLTKTYVSPVLVLCDAAALSANVTIAVTGTYNGGAQSDSIVVPTTSRLARGTALFDTITQVSSASSATGSAVISSVYPSGQPAFVEVEVAASITGRMDTAEPPFLRDQTTGTVLDLQWTFYTNVFNLRPKDILVIDGTRYEVQGAPILYDAVGRHHTEARLDQLN